MGTDTVTEKVHHPHRAKSSGGLTACSMSVLRFRCFSRQPQNVAAQTSGAGAGDGVDMKWRGQAWGSVLMIPLFKRSRQEDKFVTRGEVKLSICQ